MKRNNSLLLTVATSIIMFGSPQTVVAESESESKVLEEIVVTATRRDESMQDVPISLTALTDDDITGTGAVNLRDIAGLVPNLVFGISSNEGSVDIAIRGIYTQVNPAQLGFEQNVNVYVDGVYMGKQFSANADLGPVERVEVLRGPQSTLFGKNAIGGAINIISKKPGNEFEGSISVDAGNRDLRHVKGNINIPIIEDKLALRISAGDRSLDGYVTNTNPNVDPGSVDQTSGRIQLRYTGDRTTVDLAHDFSRLGTDDYFFEWHDQNAFADGKKFTAAHDFDNVSDIDLSGISLTMVHVFDNDYTFTSISGWREDEADFSSDIDNSPLNNFAFISNQKPEQFTQELRITSPAEGAFDFVAGLYYIDQFTVGRDRAFPGARFGPAQGEFTQGRDIDVEGFSVFAHGNYHFSEALTLFGGLRYMTETKKSDSHALTCPTNPITCRAFRLPTRTEPLRAPVDQETDEPSGSIGLRYNVNDNVMLYGSVARGVKSAAFNNSRDPIADFAAGLLVADPSFVTSYEFGVKASLLDRRAELNLAIFDMDFDDLQVRITCNSCGTAGLPEQRLTNAAAASSQGFELELHALATDSLQVTAGVGYTDAKYDKFPGVTNQKTRMIFDASGNRLALGPEWTANVALLHQLEIAGGILTSRLDVQFVDERYARSTVANFPEELIPSQSLVNARFSYRPQSDKWGVAAWVKNAADDDTIVQTAWGSGGIGGRGHLAQYQQPRTAGVTFDLQF